MNSIKKIYSRLTDGLVRTRVLPFLLSVQNIAFAILTLIFLNIIVSNGRINGELDYNRIKFFYNLITYILFTFVFLYSPYFLGGSLNSLVKNNVVEYLLAAKLNIKEIAFAAYLRGLSNVFVLVISALPIACVSLYFGGVNVMRAAKIVICLISFTILLSSFSFYISSCYKEKNVTVLVSYIMCFIVLVLHILFLKYIINISIVTFFYFLIVILVSFIFIILSFDGKVFDD